MTYSKPKVLAESSKKEVTNESGNVRCGKC